MSFIVNINGKPQIYVHAYDLGTFGRTYAMGAEADAIDVTAFADSARRRILGNQQVTLRYDGLFDATAGGPHTAFNDLRSNKRLITVWPNGATANGEKGAAITTAFANMYRPAGNMGEVLSLGFDIVSDAQYDDVWAYAAKVSTSTSTWTSTTNDITASNLSGGVFFIHVLTASAAGGNAQWNIQFQDASADVVASFATVVGVAGTNVANGVSTSLVTVITSTVRRYNRFWASLDATTGNIVFLAGFGKR